MRNKQGRTCEYSRREHACRTFVKGSTSSSSSKLTMLLRHCACEEISFFCLFFPALPSSPFLFSHRGIFNKTHHLLSLPTFVSPIEMAFNLKNPTPPLWWHRGIVPAQFRPTW